MNSLSTPPPPDIPGDTGVQQSALQSTQAPTMAPAQPQQQQQPPAPTQAQTLASLRHFSEINQAITPVLKSPELGKADLKSKIIDAVTKLVASRVVTPAAAVMQLAGVPDKPREQKAWATNLYMQNEKASALILDQHRRAFAGKPDDPHDQYNPDNHIEHMGGVMEHYRGRS